MEIKLCHCHHHVIRGEYTTVQVEGESFPRHYCKKHYMKLAEKAIEYYRQYEMSFIDKIKCFFGHRIVGELQF